MSELNQLAARIDKALSRIEAGGGVSSQSEPVADASALEDENRKLNAELEALRNQRAEDLAELDELLAQLKPLLGEENDA